jgi:hypothetical protein
MVVHHVIQNLIMSLPINLNKSSFFFFFPFFLRCISSKTISYIKRVFASLLYARTPLRVSMILVILLLLLLLLLL